MPIDTTELREPYRDIIDQAQKKEHINCANLDQLADAVFMTRMIALATGHFSDLHRRIQKHRDSLIMQKEQEFLLNLGR